MSMDPVLIELFWDKVATRGLLARNNLIAAGDFNLTLNAVEVWTFDTPGPVGWLHNLFRAHGLVDIVLDEIVPTWRNG